MRIFLITIFMYCTVANATPSNDHDAACRNYITENNENYKHAHEYTSCLKAAEAGSSGALYHIGMAYGFAGNHQRELASYKKAARLHNTSAYIAMGHVLSRKKETSHEAINWYLRYIYEEPIQDKFMIGVAASSISSTFTSLGDKHQAEYWLNYCKKYMDSCE